MPPWSASGQGSPWSGRGAVSASGRTLAFGDQWVNNKSNRLSSCSWKTTSVSAETGPNLAGPAGLDEDLPGLSQIPRRGGDNGPFADDQSPSRLDRRPHIVFADKVRDFLAFRARN